MIPWLCALALAGPADAASDDATDEAPADSAPRCDLGGDVSAPFDVPIAAEGVFVLLEVWVEDADPAWANAVLDTLAARAAPAAVVVPPGPVDPALKSILERVRATPQLELALVLPPEAVPRNLDSKLGPLRRSTQDVRRAGGRSHTVVAAIGSQGAEAMLGRAGFRALINATAPATAGPRLAGHFEGQAKIDVVFPPGPYEGPCGPDPRVGPFTPAAADRAARTIQRAAAVPGAPAVRVALHGARGAATDAEVLGRWIDEILVPGDAPPAAIHEARLAALQALRQGIDMTVQVGGIGRVVSIDDARAAAESLRDVTVLPRTLAGDLSPSEAFYAFALLAAGRDDGTSVRISGLAGPASAARTSLAGPIEVSSADVVGTAKAMLQAMPEELPAAVRVGGTLLTTSELLMALASVVRGDAPITTRPVDVPDPNARGLGWGRASLP